MHTIKLIAIALGLLFIILSLRHCHEPTRHTGCRGCLKLYKENRDKPL